MKLKTVCVFPNQVLSEKNARTEATMVSGAHPLSRPIARVYVNCLAEGSSSRKERVFDRLFEHRFHLLSLI